MDVTAKYLVAPRSRAESHLETRRNDRDAVMRLFKKPEVRYAAD